MDEEFCGTESQSHGFFWERVIRRDVFKTTPKNAYTCVNDIDKTENPFDQNENISIKTMGKDTLFLGSASRIMRYPIDQKHTAIVLVYKQIDSNKRLTRILEISLDDKRVLFGDVTLQDIEELENMLRLLPKNGKISPELRKASEEKKKDMNAKTNNGIQFNIKIDSKSQRRLQCSIPKLSVFLSRNPTIVIYDSAEPVVRGVRIPDTLTSTRRIRRKAGTKKQNSLVLRKTSRSGCI